MGKKSNKKFISDWAYKEGIFLSPNGKWIAIVKHGNIYIIKTLSQHKKREDAEIAYNNFYNSINSYE